MDPSSSDSDHNNHNESLEENNQSSLRQSSSLLRNKTPREATKKFQKIIDHLVKDEDIIENPTIVPSVMSDSKSKQFLQSNFLAPTTYRNSAPSYTRTISKADSYLNFTNVQMRFIQKNAKESVTIENTIEMMKFINTGLETYLKNTLEKLIQINRRRTSYSLPYSAHNRKVTIKTHDIKSEISTTKPYQKKYDFIPYKNFSIFYTRNINQNIAFIEKYKQIQRKEKSTTVKALNNQSGVSNAETAEINCCIYNNNDITRNSKPKLNKKRTIELKDLITFLDNEKRTPLQRILLYKAYILLTTPNK